MSNRTKAFGLHPERYNAGVGLIKKEKEHSGVGFFQELLSVLSN